MKLAQCSACVALLVLFGTANANAQCCGVVSDAQTYQYQYDVIEKPVSRTTFKKEIETRYREERIRTTKTVWDSVQETVRVPRQVPETSIYQEKHKVLKPVWVTEYRDESYDVTRQVPETSEREERVTVMKPVVEIQNREITETVRKPVQQTFYQDKVHTVQRPVTTYETRMVDKGGYVDKIDVEPGKEYNRLVWKNWERRYDENGNREGCQLPGWYWTKLRSDPKYHVQKVYKPEFVPESVPVTTYKPETFVERVPVSVTTFQEQQITRVEPVEVRKMVPEEHVRKVPVTTFKPVIQRVEKIVPVQVCKMEEQEIVRDVQRTTYKTVFEEQVREKKVPRQVVEERIIQVPYTVERWVPETLSVSASQPIVRRVSLENDGYANGTDLRPQEDATSAPITTFANYPSDSVLPQANVELPRMRNVEKRETVTTPDPEEATEADVNPPQLDKFALPPLTRK